jgi:hypothetical protein
MGKCDTCSAIHEGRFVAENAAEIAGYSELHAIHRGGGFMLERMAYRSRVHHCVRNPERRLSFIFDGMDQSTLLIPYRSNQKEFPAPLKLHLVAAKRHGHGIRFYQAIPGIRKGQNFSCFVILTELEKWYEEKGYYPEEVYIQLDGGPENANGAVVF